MRDTTPVISVIIPIHNGALWVDQCMQSVYEQRALKTLPVEISVYDDASTDETPLILLRWQSTFIHHGNAEFTLSRGSGSPKGVGFAKNQAVKQSKGQYLCFQDVDDIMLPDRIELQYIAAKELPQAIIGSQFKREPPESTARFTRWANGLSQNKLSLQVYTSHGPTLIMPTWFFNREVFNRVGGFSEAGQGIPEDLIFFYKHLDLGGTLHRVDRTLLIYRYHEGATTFSIHEDTIWKIRVERLEEVVLKRWPEFTIWNAGRQGRKLYHSLSPSSRMQVVALCDVDDKKVGSTYQPYFPENPTSNRTGPKLPIVSYKDAKAPFVICVKLDLTDGEFERNLASLNLIEGEDYIIFS